VNIGGARIRSPAHGRLSSGPSSATTAATEHHPLEESGAFAYRPVGISFWDRTIIRQLLLMALKLFPADITGVMITMHNGPIGRLDLPKRHPGSPLLGVRYPGLQLGPAVNIGTRIERIMQDIPARVLNANGPPPDLHLREEAPWSENWETKLVCRKMFHERPG